MDISLLASDVDSAAADFLSIDDLLDFSNEEIGGPIDSEVASPEEGSSPSEAEASMASSQESAPRDKSSCCLQPPCVFDSDKLCVPCEDLAELEWLSTFVEESFSSGSDTTTAFCLDSSGKSAGDDDCKVQGENSKDSSQSTGPMSVLHSSFHSRDTPMSFPCRSDMSAPARTRTKRGRTAVCFWNTQILSVEASESILESSSTASTITSDSDMINDTFYDHNDDDDYDENEDDDGEEDDDDDDDDIIDDIMEDRMRHHSHHQHRRFASNGTVRSKKFNKGMTSLASKKLKKFKAAVKQPDVVRKCLHCATQKTPQWRAGPMGPKTLCNACGVRYKSGRLCAEYRPASSPTFVDNLHSNSHRKVLEMRRQRGDVGTNSSSFDEKPSQCGQGSPI